MSLKRTEPHLPRPLSPQRLGAIRKRLLQWYAGNEQPFPWRHARDPYAALVAAVCAQQTQMSRVLEVYDRWMSAFPTIEDLAQATSAEAIRVWGRAGYPRRAVYLHQTAQVVCNELGGQLPTDRKALERLPGVGPFTAAIILNFGHGIDAAAVDTNITRVLGRVLFGALQPALETRPADIRWATERLLPENQATRWNPALMDFGASICTPNPKCDSCPLPRLCDAHAKFMSGARASAVRAQSSFVGSQREIRGLLMSLLRDADGPLPRDSVLLDVVQRTGAKRSRVTLAERSLIEDGLIRRGDHKLFLGSER
ncbi:MAG: A/G-specific adenine glycosylase [Chloroflexota bacterium]|nr:A/G-specific adenine glycosylase [Chloroflexota bacterium]MDE2894777.1 A/G-specific adenine glycosylase [Chloroflexota bacterium]